MRLIAMACLGVLPLLGCAERQTPTAAPDSTPTSAASPSSEDACGAASRQAWIGRARSELPSAPSGADWRVFETGQPVIQDLRANRLNIEIDPARQTVVRVSCG
ncbi:MAG: peptidase inhibitor I78 [Brevundimonas sp.]|nr:MAG: peptidase inhibitor I78 [Brevundimonas sp.]